MKRVTKENTSDQLGRKSNPLIKGTYSIMGAKKKKVYAYCAYYSKGLVVYDNAFQGELEVTLDITSVINSLKANKLI